MVKPRIAQFTRRIKKKYAWFPTKLDNAIVWFDHYYAQQIFYHNLMPFGQDSWVNTGEYFLNQQQAYASIGLNIETEDEKARRQIKALLT